MDISPLHLDRKMANRRKIIKFLNFNQISLEPLENEKVSLSKEIASTPNAPPPQMKKIITKKAEEKIQFF